MEGILQHIQHNISNAMGNKGRRRMDPILGRAKSVSMPASQVGCTGKTDGKKKRGILFFLYPPP